MDYLEKYSFSLSAEEIADRVAGVLGVAYQKASREVYLKCFSLMDLTTLKSNDTMVSVGNLVAKVNRLHQEYPQYPLPASICVYPNFAGVVASARCCPELHTTCVAACFPTAQSFLEVKKKECEMAVEAGADEIDIVLALNSFLVGDYGRASAEISEIRQCLDEAGKRVGRRIILKVILETGLLVSVESIAQASFLAMEAGADFIKTSTGKVEVNATPQAAYVMCECIRKYYEKTGRKVGFKAAGGISNAQEALAYYCIGAALLGEEWINRDTFRFGVSRLGNSLMSEIEQKSICFF